MLGAIRSTKKKIYIVALIFVLFTSMFDISVIADSNRPDLIIESVTFSGNVTEGSVVEFVVKIKNIVNTETGEYGNVSSGTAIVVALIIDGAVAYVNSTSQGLNVSQSCYVNLSWTATLGAVPQHTLSIEVDYPHTIAESNENNNAWDGFISVYEKGPVLEIISFTMPESIVVGKTAQILSEIKNNGGATTETIYAKLNSSETGPIETVSRQASLPRQGTCNFSFNWTPSRFGSQKITLDIFYAGATHDLEQKTVMVGVDKLAWWNENWHYRHFLSVNGSGNVSKYLNFTEFLNELGVVSETFENDTIRVVEYRKNGTVVGEITNYNFNESTSFNAVNNATGSLIWNVTGASFEKYYCIYFDVAGNLGTRTAVNETLGIAPSGNATIGYFGFIDGWQAEITSPSNGSFKLVGELIDINVFTMSKAENVSAFVFLKGNESHNFTLYLSNPGNYTYWTQEDFSFDAEGNWTIRVLCRDWAGYNPRVVENSFFVGKPDLEIKNISFTTDWPPTSPTIYKNDTVNITAHVTSYYANVESVNVTVSIFDIANNLTIYTKSLFFDILKDKTNYVSFSWKAIVSGEFNVTVRLDPDNVIGEENESNNNLFKKMTVYEWPDLAIVNIGLPSIEVTEFDKVKIDVNVSNKGLGNATGYEIALYIEQSIMTYSHKVDSAIVDISINSSKTVSLYWASAEPGTHLVAARAIVTDSKNDTNHNNNRLLSNETLYVKPIERNPPVISDLATSPASQQQGGPITISAKITDDTGIESVVINIVSPSNHSYTSTMVRTIGNEFEMTYTDTLDVGIYSFKITAVDISIHRNTAVKNDSFVIKKDTAKPVISYFDARPFVQKAGERLTITCVASDNIGIKSVVVTIIYPDGSVSDGTMTLSGGKYVYSSQFSASGKYSYYLEVTDKAGNIVSTDYSTFWISSNVQDTDSDGMPDSWENKYGLDPQDPSDADLDPDGDTYSNLDEYNMGTNPTKDIFIENAAFRIKENALYIASAIGLFFFLIVLLFIGKRRGLK